MEGILAQGSSACVAAARPRPGAVTAAATCAALARRPLAGRRLGVVLGTGLGVLADRLTSPWSIAARDTDWLPGSTATGHAGRLVWGGLAVGGRESAAVCDVVMLQGRVHGYEGHEPERLVRGVELLAALGAGVILLTNAAGGLRPDMQAGELVVVSDHIDLSRRGRPAGGDRAPAPVRGGPLRPGCAAAAAPCYEPALVEAALGAARCAGATARAGVYAHLMGPSYETRAEYRMLRRFGADVVGMSTVPEAIAARELGLRVAAVSVVTNVARPDAAERTDAEDVCRAAAAGADGVWAIVERAAALSQEGSPP